MPSTRKALLGRLSAKISKLRHRFRSTKSDDPPLPTTYSVHHVRHRRLSQNEPNAPYVRTQQDLGQNPVDTSAHPVVGPVADTTAASQPDAFSLADSEEFYVVSREGMPEMGMEGSEGEEGGETEEEDWREEWEDLGMQLREGARRKVVITTFTTSEAEVAEDGRHDSGYYEDYDFDYWKVIAALQEPQEESLGGDLGARSGGVRKQLRQIALGDSDDEEEDVDVELVERSQDLGSMRTRDGGVAGGDVWWR